MKFRKLRVSAAVSAALFCMSAVANVEDADDYVTTDEVKVTASRVEKDLVDVPMSVSVITAEDIKRSGAQTIGDLLETIPGVRINNDGSQGMKRAKIRGEDAFRTLVMIDGQKVSEQKSMSGSPMLIDPSMVERIEVIKGPASVLYGSDAIGGAINIITKKGGDKPFGAEASFGMNTSNSGTSASAAVFGSYEGWHYRLGVAHEKGDDLDTPKGKMEDTNFKSLAANLFIAYDINANTSVGFTLDHYDLAFMSSDYDTPGFYVDVPKWTRTKLGVFAEMKNVSDYLTRLRFDAFYQKNDKSMLNHVVSSGMTYAVNMDNWADNSLDQYGFSVQSDWQLGEKHYLIAGYELNYDDLDATSSVDFSMIVNGHTMSSYLKNGLYVGSMLTHSVYASMESQLPMNFALTYGARYTYVDTDMDKSSSYKHYTVGNSGDSIEDTAGSKSDDRVVFNAGLVWRGIDDLALRLTWAQGFRSPLLQERYIPTSMGQASSTTYGNPDLKPETSDNFELGARWTPGALTLDASVFLSLADDYITSLPWGTSGNYRYENVAEAKTYGLELAASYVFRNLGLEPYVSLTWLSREFDYGDGFKTHDTGEPDFYARYGVKWEGNIEGFAVHADAYAWTQSASDYKSTDGDSDYHMGGATTFNLKGGVAFGPQKQYGIEGGFYNITNKAYRDSLSIWNPGRHMMVKLNVKY